MLPRLVKITRLLPCPLFIGQSLLCPCQLKASSNPPHFTRGQSESNCSEFGCAAAPTRRGAILRCSPTDAPAVSISPATAQYTAVALRCALLHLQRYIEHTADLASPRFTSLGGPAAALPYILNLNSVDNMCSQHLAQLLHPFIHNCQQESVAQNV